MKVSAKGDYACRAMLDIVLNFSGNKPIQIHDISKRQNIPVKFLEQILMSLKTAGFLESRRGVGGGYFLKRDPKEITLGEILRITDSSLFESNCIRTANEAGPNACSFDTDCAFREVIDKASKAMIDILDGVTFDDLVARYRIKGFMYFI